MKWFEKQEIKNKDSLTPAQINYLKSPSLTIVAPFNFLARKQWDFFLTSLILAISIVVLTFNENPGVLSSICIIFSCSLLLAVNYFFVKHGRRLAWNRNKWNDFEAFEKSESKWLIFASATLGLSGFNFIRAFGKEADWEEIIGLLFLLISFCLPFLMARWKNKTTEISFSKME